MTTVLSLPRNADRYVWDHPDQWQPGDPIYRSTTAERWQRDADLVSLRGDPHEDDCTGTNCLRLDDSQFHWTANGGDVQWMRGLFGAEPAGPGTEFYGAVIGP